MPYVKTALDKLFDFFTATIAASCPTIKTFQIGYIGEVATGQTDYDVLLLLPPKATIPEPRNWNKKEYAIHYFLMRQDKGAALDRMTPAERILAWGALDTLNKVLINAIIADNANRMIKNEVTVDYNSGGGDQILPDAVVWIEVTFTMIVSDC